jgi:hypothetical protein
MSTYQPSPFVEPLGYQPVEFLDIPPTTESIGTEEFLSIRHVSACRLVVTITEPRVP